MTCNDIPHGLARDPLTDFGFFGRGAAVINAQNGDPEKRKWEYRSHVGTSPWKPVKGVGDPGLDEVVQARRKPTYWVSTPWGIAVEQHMSCSHDDGTIGEAAIADFSVNPPVIRNANGEYLCRIRDDGMVNVRQPS